jgi:ubiquinone/menaquinone biosynthesis C-methylase UbiE
MDDLPRLEGTICCQDCGLAFSARGGVLDLVPEITEGRRADLKRRIVSPPLRRLYEETIRHMPTPLASSITDEDRVRWILDHAPTEQVERVIDLGCGRGLDLELMERAVSPSLAVGIDLSRASLSEAATRARLAGRRNVAFLRADLEQLPLQPGLFDWANCFGVLHRLARPVVALERLSALLRPRGVLTCLTSLRLPEGPMEKGQRALGWAARVHFFEEGPLRQMLEVSDLERIELEPFGAVALLAAHRIDGVFVSSLVEWNDLP